MSGNRILIVEDEVLVAEEIRMRLVDLGYEVDGVINNGEDALVAAEGFRPDLVLMDIKLKGEMDGISAANRIKADLGIPVLYLTAYTDKETLQRAKATQPFAYLVKPLGERELHVAVEIALYRHKIEMERDHYIKKLEKTLSEVKTLTGLLPICASCKSIRNDDGYWQQVEAYIESHTLAHLDEAICPDCLRKANIDVESFKRRIVNF